MAFPVVDGLRAIELGTPGEMRPRRPPRRHGDRDRGCDLAPRRCPRSFALADAEGDLDGADFRASHRAFWSSVGALVTDDKLVVQLYFDLLESPAS